ncbi:MFS transporter [Rhizosphaericola mali]|uniref:MFS transporter n=1 Tax=Rhizosphaericola mali TaxID=2545455 RepID=UPI00177B2C98|nr:MFS transporter [Rhizosphaericola mali]
MNLFGNNAKAARVIATNSATSIEKSLSPQLQKTKIRVRFAVAIFYFFQGLCFASWASRIPYIKSTIGITDGQMGSILLALPAGQLITMPISAYLVDKYGSKNVLKFGLPLYAIALTFLGLAPTKLLLSLGLFIFGVFGNFCNISVNTQGVNAERMYHRPIMATFHGAWSIAGFTGAIIGLLMSKFTIVPEIHFWIIAILSIIGMLMNVKYLMQDGIKKITANKEKKSMLANMDSTIIQLGVIGFFAMACEGAMFDWSGVYFKEIVKVKQGWESVGYACFMVMMATGRFVGDKVVAKFGRKKLMQVCGVLIMIGLLVAVIFPYFLSASFGFILVGFGVSTNIPNVYSVAGNQTKIPSSAALAAVSSISYLGFLMGPPLIGYTSQLFNLRLSYTIIAIFGLCITIMVTRLKVIK